LVRKSACLPYFELFLANFKLFQVYYITPHPMKLTFHGAARQVTGSMFLLELQDHYKILIDCGINFDSRHVGNSFPFEPEEIDLVLLTHAHLDHSGRIPQLYEQGYTGQVLCTLPTVDLAQLILTDAATIRSKNVKRKLRRRQYHNRKVNDEKLLDDLVKEAADCFVPIAFNQRFELRSDAYLTFIPAGHLLGAAHILLEIEEDGVWTKIGFSGDIGRNNYPLLSDPIPMPQVDYLICETTYGSRQHQEVAEPEALLNELINDACVNISGKLIIPSFSVGRTQALLFTLNKLEKEGKLPPIKIFADSPMANASTEIYQKHIRLLNNEAQSFYKENGSLFEFNNLTIVESMKESKAIADHNEPSILISSSGMISGGRIQEHIRRNLGNQYCTILLVGYSTDGTIGNSLYRGERVINLNGKNYPVAARIFYTDVFSGHADQKDLMNFVSVQKAEKLKQIFLVHGEPESMTDFSVLLNSEGYQRVEMPEFGQEYIL
jgi:metallo-beta-lactamase family protein